MKRSNVSGCFLLFFVALLLSSGVSWGQYGSLNVAPSASPRTPGKTNIAVINMKNTSGVTSGEIEVISDRLRGELFNTGKVNVMERDQMQEILKEQGFQQSGACTNEACMVEMGQLLGVEQLITGSLGKVGSMFLVNLRVIDVKTAKIVKVVSVDIKGDLEEVVSQLPGISSQLVAPVTQNEQSATLEKKGEAAKPEVVKEAKEESKVETTPEVTDERKERNKNRSGMRLAFNLYGNGLVAKTHVTHYDENGNNTGTDVYTAAESLYTFSPLLNPQVKFFFKAGPFITIDVGPSYAYEAIESKYGGYNNGNYYQYGDYLNVFGLAVGVNFVKRWYPVKMNIGLMLDFNGLLNMEEYKFTDPTYTGNPDSVSLHSSVNASVGLRAGAEIMVGKHVGFNLDLLLQYSYFETEQDEYDSPDGTYYNKWFLSYLLPIFGIGFGVNYYY
jgi:curli biogenesis system outer membrane secretion channel CsgG